MLPDRFIDRSKQSHNGILAGPAVKKVRQGAQHGYKQDAPNHCFFHNQHHPSQDMRKRAGIFLRC